MEELIQAMSNEDLAKLKQDHEDSQSIATLVDGILEARANEVEQAKAKKAFEAGIAKLFAKLPHPEDVHNVYIRWADVEVEDKSAEPEEVEVVVTPAEINKDGKITTPAVMGKEKRYPTIKGFAWVVEVNKGFATSRVSGSSANKRAITLFKREGLKLVDKGNYPSASKACASLGITIGGDSASRVLSREGYIIEPYTGTDYTS